MTNSVIQLPAVTTDVNGQLGQLPAVTADADGQIGQHYRVTLCLSNESVNTVIQHRCLIDK